MGDMLNEPVSDHPQYLPFATFDPSLSVAQALASLCAVPANERTVPVQPDSNYNSLQVTVTKHLR